MPAHRDQYEEYPERRVGDVWEDVVEVWEAQHEVTAEVVVKAQVVIVVALRRRADIRQHNLQRVERIFFLPLRHSRDM